MSIVNTKPVSESLNELIQKANSTFEQGKHYVILAYEQALDEGFTPQEAKKLLFEKITAFSDRTIYRYLPDEAKDQKAVQLANSSKKNLPSLTSGNDSLDSKPKQPLHETLSLPENKPREDGGFVQAIDMHGYTIACVNNNDGSIFCWLCLLDEAYELAPHNKYVPVPIMYSNRDFNEHLFNYHGIDKGWSRYKPHMDKLHYERRHFKRS